MTASIRRRSGLRAPDPSFDRTSTHRPAGPLAFLHTLRFTEEQTMEKDLSRRKFLEHLGLGTAAGVSLSLLNELLSLIHI